ncbi:hypothetical protein [Saccharibacillus brassicae]|uniref:CYTH domain-containing protein n=1 Tax=Saccharibacillus brassicae TaxID=2583377 RepID=A0A4Y6V441_SACBS|nr:hypothetical protein [Saccharibacillus brassicae]QDH23336.1 hypothetical protein FFV09_22195 [Saccharibacillus brassicae]
MNTKSPNAFTKKLTVTALSAAVLFTSWGAAPQAHAASNATPTYEVKFLLDSSDVLNANGSLQASVNAAFEITSAPKRQLVEYFDTNAQDLNGEGWNVRFRKKEDKSDYELTYKKRFAVQNGQIDAALSAANAAGFDSSDTNYEAEVDWGYGKQTLGFSNTKKVKASTGLILPSASKALELLVKEIPGKLEKTRSNGWGKDTLKKSRVHGPIEVTKYAGEFNGVEIDIEVLPLLNASGTGTEPLIEISFKTDDYSAAAANRAELMDELNAEGWLIPADSLKTNTILDRY